MHTTTRIWTSWGEYLQDLKDNVVPGRTHGTEPGSGFTYTASWEECWHLATHGWDRDYAQVESVAQRVENHVLTDVLTVGFESTYDMAGAECDLTRYLDGTPECMLEATPVRISRHGRAVRLVVGASFLAAVEHEDVIYRGTAIVALCDILARAQHPVEVWWANAASNSYQTTRQLVRIQSANDVLDIPRMLFGFAHPDAQRRIAFAGREVFGGMTNGNVGGTINVHPEWLVEEEGEIENTITLQPCEPGDRWNADIADEWVTTVVESVFS